MKKLAISLLVVGAVFGNLVHPADNQIKRLEIVLEKRNKELFQVSPFFKLISEEAFKNNNFYKGSSSRLFQIPLSEEELRKKEKVDASIDSLKRKIKKLTDLKADGYIE